MALSWATSEAMADENKRDIGPWRLYFGWALVILGCGSPLLVPFILNSTLPAGAKAVLSALVAFGLPELLILSALPVLGRERLKAFFASIKKLLGRILPIVILLAGLN